MKKIIKKMFGHKSPSKDGLYGFIENTSVSEKDHFIKQVIKESNKDQRDLVERYNRKFAKA